MGLAHTGAPGARTHPGRGGDDRPARAGVRERRRDGDGRAVPGGALRPARVEPCGPPHVGDLLGRRHDGGHQPRSRVDARAPRARQADRLLRRQPDHDRRDHSVSDDSSIHRERFARDGWHVQPVHDSEDVDGDRAAPCTAPARNRSGRPPSRFARTSPTRRRTRRTRRPPRLALGERGGAPPRSERSALTRSGASVVLEVYEPMEHAQPARAEHRQLGARPRPLARRVRGHGARLGPRMGGTAARELAGSAPASSRRARSSRPAKRAAGRWRRSPRMRRRWSGAPPTLSSRPGPRSRARGCSRPSTPAGTSRSGSASTRWERSSTARRSRRHRQAVWLDVPDLLRLHAPQRAALRADGTARLWVWTHDSVGLGEDGPTHQPVEQCASLRAIPGLWVIRPADANETALAWRAALERTDGPVALLLSRQEGADDLPRPGYRLRGRAPARRIRAVGLLPAERGAPRARADRDRR